jgi:predicted NUDIX family NTP pyrophosphohydrolase
MVKKSGGILMYKQAEDGVLHVLIAHMGGPLWAKRSRSWLSAASSSPKAWRLIRMAHPGC